MMSKSDRYFVRGTYLPSSGLMRIPLEQPDLQDGWVVREIHLLPRGDFGTSTVLNGMWCAGSESLFMSFGTNENFMVGMSSGVARFQMKNGQLAWAIANGNYLAKPYIVIDEQNWIAEDLFMLAWVVNDLGSTSAPAETFSFILELEKVSKTNTGALLEMVADRSQSSSQT